jgi:flagellar hook-associated protein FlgK
LLSYEEAFQAGARIINVIDEMLDLMINRMGLVGR